MVKFLSSIFIFSCSRLRQKKILVIKICLKSHRQCSNLTYKFQNSINFPKIPVKHDADWLLLSQYHKQYNYYLEFPLCAPHNEAWFSKASFLPAERKLKLICLNKPDNILLRIVEKLVTRNSWMGAETTTKMVGNVTS